MRNSRHLEKSKKARGRRKQSSYYTRGEMNLRAGIDDIASQLGITVDGNFDFTVRASLTDETLDKLTMLIQQLGESVDRAISFNPSSIFGGAAWPMPDPIASRFLRVNDAGTTFEWASVVGGGGGGAIFNDLEGDPVIVDGAAASDGLNWSSEGRCARPGSRRCRTTSCASSCRSACGGCCR